MMNIQVAHECGSGWKQLIDPITARADSNGYTMMQIKEKYGALRLYYVPGPIDDIEFEDMVDDAELASTKICEMCGKPGHLMDKGGWLKTLCQEDGIYLSYRELKL